MSPGSNVMCRRQVRQDVVDRERHFADRTFLHDLAVDVRAHRLLAHVDAAHDAGADRAEAVLALHAQHRTCVGVAEILRADVVGRRESREVVPHVFARDVAHRLADDRRDLAFVVQVFAVRRAVEQSAMAVERGQRLLEVRRRYQLRRLELDAPRLVVQMDADDLRRIARRQIHRIGISHGAAVTQTQQFTVGAHPRRRALMTGCAATLRADRSVPTSLFPLYAIVRRPASRQRPMRPRARPS